MGLLVGVVLIMGGLAYFPAVSLGPVTEQVAMNQGSHLPGTLIGIERGRR